MPFTRTGPLRRQLARTLPSRPFAVRFWDGRLLPATNGDGAMFTLRSPAAVACVLRAPGQLGIGRAYVAGLLEVDDLDAALELLSDWHPPPLDRSIRGLPCAACGRRLARARWRSSARESPVPVAWSGLKPSWRSPGTSSTHCGR